MREAVPKYISGSTSYNRVCLAFHPYPQLIQMVFNPYWFGPPRSVTCASSWSRIDHTVSRLPPRTKAPYSDSVSLRMHVSKHLSLHVTSNSLAHYAKGTRSPCKRAPTVCKHMVSGSISLPSEGFFSPFPHGTGSLSVTEEYLALPGGPGRFTQDSTCPVLLRIPLSSYVFRLQDFHLL